MSDPLSYATNEFDERKAIRDDMPTREVTYLIIRKFLEECISEDRGTPDGEFVHVLNDLNNQFHKCLFCDALLDVDADDEYCPRCGCSL